MACEGHIQPCAAQSFCYHNGTCCMTENNESFCVCSSAYMGDRCEYLRDEHIFTFAQIESNMKAITLSCIMSITIGILALVALIVVITMYIRKTQQQQTKREVTFDRQITILQEEIDKLPTVSKMIQLGRLTKLFDKSARDVVLAEPLPEPKVPESDGCLPRWSSAPCSIDLGLDHVDGDVIEKAEKKRLQQVFSMCPTSAREATSRL